MSHEGIFASHSVGGARPWGGILQWVDVVMAYAGTLLDAGGFQRGALARRPSNVDNVAFKAH